MQEHAQLAVRSIASVVKEAHVGSRGIPAKSAPPRVVAVREDVLGVIHTWTGDERRSKHVLLAYGFGNFEVAEVEEQRTKEGCA